MGGVGLVWVVDWVEVAVDMDCRCLTAGRIGVGVGMDWEGMGTGEVVLERKTEELYKGAWCST
jgi:hypothetical protein